MTATIFRRARSVDRKDLVLAALYFIQQHREYAVMTQLHKILTIAQEESGVRVFKIEPGKFGPLVKDLYRVLEELEEAGLVVVERVEKPGSRHGYEYEYKVRLTPEGEREARAAVRRLLRSGHGWLVGTLEAWAGADYRALIYYTYKMYPQYIDKSIIADEVRRREY